MLFQGISSQIYRAGRPFDSRSNRGAKSAALRATKPLWRVKNVAFFGPVQKFSFLHCQTGLVSPFSTDFGVNPQNKNRQFGCLALAGASVLFRLPRLNIFRLGRNTFRCSTWVTHLKNIPDTLCPRGGGACCAVTFFKPGLRDHFQAWLEFSTQ